ncbi:MAG: nuclear transport factor 2 family protein [Gammaproteobacteria bacterium]|nr:nuclear transport factor 2 family protein [Gammaproteobacteria bacterium]NNL99642.1 nuclear transport factor 2 family protein [Gammaproteobacteria bacterium]
MAIATLETWHELVESRNVAGLDALLADAIVFYSPVVHTPQRGRQAALMYLTAAFHVFLNESFRYVRELRDEHQAILEFEMEIDGISINGVDMIKWDEDGRINEFKVMIRPLKGVNMIHQKMAAMLEAAR